MQWTDVGGGGTGTGRRREEDGDTEIPLNAILTQAKPEGANKTPAARSKAANGHHYVPKAIVKDKHISDEAKAVFDRAKTGKLFDIRSNKWDREHRLYSKAVGEALDEYLAKNHIKPQDMTGVQAREFLGKVFESSDPPYQGI